MIILENLTTGKTLEFENIADARRAIASSDSFKLIIDEEVKLGFRDIIIAVGFFFLFLAMFRYLGSVGILWVIIHQRSFY